MSTPAKPWRVTGPDGTTDYRGETTAYQEGVKPIVTSGHDAQVEHWEDGRWVLWDTVAAGDW